MLSHVPCDKGERSKLMCQIGILTRIWMCSREIGESGGGGRTL
jgi:hypothetical protein